MDYVLTFLILVLYIKQGVIAIAVHKVVHQKDMSEHCKRRVIPSVFLGKQVMQAGSHVMHFSQLEVPYSCFLSVRAESGYNIILVIELLSEQSLIQACAQNGDQLIVYEMGETFGGYWGPQPDVMMKSTVRNYTKYYTLKTTRPPSTKRPRHKYKNVTEKVLKETFPPATDRESDYIRMEIPLVNVSGNLQLGGPLRHSYNAEEMFDIVYDVTPRNGSEYDTSIMPLVQFSIKPQIARVGYDGNQRYELDYDLQGFTLDPRLDFVTYNRRITSKQRNWLANRRINFAKKNTQLYARKNKALNFQKLFTHWSSMTNATIKSSVMPTLDPKYLTVSWKYIEDILRYLNSTSVPSLEENTTNLTILNNISNREHNISVYLNANITLDSNRDNYINKEDNNYTVSFNAKLFTRKNYRPILLSSMPFKKIEISTLLTDFVTEKTVGQTASLFLKDLNSTTDWTTEYSILNYSFYNNNIIVDSNTYLTNQTKVNNNMDNYKIKEQNKNDDKVNISSRKLTHDPIAIKLSSISTRTTIPLRSLVHLQDTALIKITSNNDTATTPPLRRGTMVDHKSWENVVQAAPIMAVVLNKTDARSVIKLKNSRDEVKKVSNSKRKKKRHIQSLRVDKSRPRNLTTKPSETTQTEPLFRITDIHDLARLVELQDDEMEGRVALRYLRNYVGSALFNLCNFAEPKARQTFMFNASRIVIAVNNFTLDRMMLVTTPAQSLIKGASRCPPAHLECQIVGTRVCIDNTNSCDGVPNCGSYDIYDEDRLMCGVTKGLQHNVYLAAFTFLAVLLTMLYTVYYWLKRCVPRVSEAFFTYADTSENTLFLDSIMRSPTDIDNASSKSVFPVHDYDDDILYEDKQADVGGNICVKLLRNCCRILLCKTKRKESQPVGIAMEYESNVNKPTRLFSFTELELRKFATTTLKDEGIQTGDSYDLPQGELKNELDIDLDESLNKLKVVKKLNEDKYSSELSLIKIAKQRKSSLTQCDLTFFEEKDPKKNRKDAIIADDEKEIKSTVYERHSNKSVSSSEIPVVCEVHPEIPKKRDKRRLRFDDAPTLIPSEDVEEDVPGPSIARRSVVLGVGHLNKQDLDKIIEGEETPSSSKDFMRFWGKKGKKKEKLSKHS